MAELQPCPTCGHAYEPGVRWLRGMESTKCSWVEHMPDGDFQCSMSPGHWVEIQRAPLRHDVLYAHNPTIRLTERSLTPT